MRRRHVISIIVERVNFRRATREDRVDIRNHTLFEYFDVSSRLRYIPVPLGSIGSFGFNQYFTIKHYCRCFWTARDDKKKKIWGLHSWQFMRTCKNHAAPSHVVNVRLYTYHLQQLLLFLICFFSDDWRIDEIKFKKKKDKTSCKFCLTTGRQDLTNLN